MSILANKITKVEVLFPITLGILICTLLFPTSPLLSQRVPPDPDSGVFLYAGTRLLEGEIPYRDFWDHKPPAIFYVNALGLALSSGEQWGVWVLEVLAVCLAAALSFFVLKKAFNQSAALIGSSIWLLNGVYVFWLGNLPDVYVLPLHFAMFSLFCSSYRVGFGSWRGYLAGFLFGVTFFFKSNFIGIWIALPVYLVIVRHLKTEKARILRELGMLLLGASSVFTVVLGYFAWHGALDEFIDAVVRFNVVYAAHNSLPSIVYDRYWSLRTGFIINQYSGSTLLALLGWVGGITYVRAALHQKGDDNPASELRVHLLLWLILALPIEILLSVAGRFSLLQYFCSWQPVFSVMIGFLVFVVFDMLESYAQHLGGAVKLRPTAFFVIFMLLVSLLPISDLIRFYREPQIIPEMKPTFSLSRYLKTHTEKDEPIVIWGREAAALYLSERHSPTRFFYTIAFAEYAPDYMTTDVVREYVQDIIETRPVLIIFTQTTTNVPFTASGKLIPAEHVPLEWQRLFDFIFSNYELTNTIGYGWPVYRLKS